MPKVVVFTRDFCAFCRHAKALLKSKGVDFEEIDISQDEALQEKVWKSSGRKTVPQIIVDGRPLGGFEELRELDASGELDEILNIHR